MKNIEKNFKFIGLAGKETDVYLAILKLKKATVIQLANTTNIKRTSIYHCLDSLISKGLISKVIKDDKKYYLAEDPKISLNNLLKEKKDAINSIMPQLKNIFGIGAFQPEIKIYKNPTGIKKIFEDILASKTKISRYYISDFSLENLLGNDFVDEFVKKRIKAGIKSFSLRTFDYKPTREKESSQNRQLREIRFMPDKFIIKPYICIYDNKVVMISATENKTAFIIESKEFAEAQKTIFDIIWNSIAI